MCVTGAAGSVGRELIKQLIGLPLRELRALDNDENGLYDLSQVFAGDRRIRPLHCDITKREQVDRCLMGAQLIFHAAAVKHVPSCETSPWAAVDVNIRGLGNVIDSAIHHRADRVVFTSSDKAVSPGNVMGASKLIGERIALTAHKSNGHTVIACTRFGNIAGSRGSVIPLFSKQIREGGPITLTSPEMTRFFMSIEDAGRLVIDSMMSAHLGEIFVTRMQAMRIQTLAVVLRNLIAPAYGRIPAGIDIKICMERPGEKLSEELVTAAECLRSISTRDYIVVLPPSIDIGSVTAGDYPLLGGIGPIDRPYDSASQQHLDEDEVQAFLEQADLLPVAARTRLKLRDKLAEMAPPVASRRARTPMAVDVREEPHGPAPQTPAILTDR